MKIQYVTKVCKNIDGEEFVVLKQSFKSSDFIGEHNLSNATVFPGVLKRLVMKIVGNTKRFKLNAHPSYVSIEGNGLFRTVTINLN